MKTDWTEQDAKALCALLENTFGTSDYFEFSITRHFRQPSIKLKVTWTRDDKSRTELSTEYAETELGTVVHADIRRGWHPASGYYRIAGTSNPVNGAEKFDNTKLPESVEEWATILIDASAKADAEYIKNKEAHEKNVLLADVEQTERRSKRQNLSDLKFTYVSIVNYEFDPGDKRSMGSLIVTANTNLGQLVLKCSLSSSGSVEEMKVILDGKRVNTDNMETSFDPATPHYYSGHRAIENWESMAMATLKDALNEYLRPEGETNG